MYLTTTRPRSGIFGMGAVVVLVVDVVVGGSIACGWMGSSAVVIALALLATAIAVVPQASAAPVQAAILAQRIGNSLLMITVFHPAVRQSRQQLRSSRPLHAR